MSIFTGDKKGGINEAKNNATLLLIAIICAVAAWFIVAMTKYPSESKTISGVPLIADLSGTSAADNGLSVIEKKIENVTVSFDCSRTDYARITSDTIKAYVDFENITTAGRKTLTVKVESTNGAELSNVKVNPDIVTVVLDKIEMRTVNIQPKCDSITAADGKSLGDMTCDPSEITIKGPAEQIAKISECYAVSDKELVLEDSATVNSNKFQFMLEDGTELLDANNITADPSVVNISIPVLTQKTVKFTTLIGTSSNSNFDTDSLKFDISPEEITIATSSSDVKLVDNVEIKIPLSTIDLGFSKSYSIDNLLNSSNNNITNISGISTVTVTLNDEGLAYKELSLSKANVDLRHVPSDGYDYDIVNDKVPVTLIGPADVINDITAADLDAEVNFINTDTSKTPLQFVYNVDVSCKTSNRVWCVDTPKVNILKTPKAGATTQAAASGNSTSKTN